MKRLTHFFWVCSGVHVSTLKSYSTEHNKYIGIGATIFFTGVFASLSGGYALYFVFKGGDFATLSAILFGIIWGSAIFNMDRYIVSSINKNASARKQFLQATPRILLAIMIGVVISRPLELKIFDKEIKDRLKITYLNEQRAKIDTLNKTFESKYKTEVEKVSRLKAERDSLMAGIKADQQKLNFEIFGNKTTETSGLMGYGPYAKRKEAELKQRTQDLDTLNKTLTKAEEILEERKKFNGLTNEKLYTSQQLDSLSSVAGFADRNRALGQLSKNANGTTDSATSMAVTFIGLLFIFFECLPVFVKLMSEKGPYDQAITDLEDTQIYASGKDKAYQIAVINNVHETRVNAETAHQKQVIHNRS